MEPLIHVNDAFIVVPARTVQMGDIIMFRPVVLQAPFITHRIVGMGDRGYITKGDNSPYQDQESREPEVRLERIVGKVLTINGQPLIIPGLGSFSAGALALLGKNTRTLAAIFLLLGILAAFIGRHHAAHKPKPRRRIRLGQVYRFIVLSGIGVVILSIFLGSHVTAVKYLVSEYPGSLGDQVELNQPGQLKLEAKNNGLFPVRTVITGVAPLSVAQAPEYIRPLSSQTVVLDVAAHRETGVQQGYVQIYNYPALLPGAWIAALHGVSPMLAAMSTGMAMGLWLVLFFKLLRLKHGFDGWIPLKAIKDKIIHRRMYRVKAIMFGRRRSR
jgi:signal peptidase